MAQPIVKQKSLVRKAVNAAIASIASEVRIERSAMIAGRLFSLPDVANAESLAIFLSMPQEVQTGPIIEHIISMEKTIYCPKIVGKERCDMKMVQVAPDEISTLPKSRWGIPEPDLDGRTHAEDADIGVVVLPGVAFDAHCRRVGHGKGYYDTFVTNLRHRYEARGLSAPILVGICFDEQIVDEVPTAEHDVTLDFIVTPTRLFQRAG